MAPAHIYNAISRYRQVRTEGAVEDASPHRLIAMLFDGALSRIALAAAHMRRGEIEDKGAQITRALEIVGALRASLDMNVPGGLPQRLDSLYDYVSRRMLHANIENDPKVLDEVGGLLRVIADAWAQVAPPAHVAGAA
ncbi:MAG TPA: flagellar export chaperone FliS [Rhodanobacteraceae bacterium]|nr:flagellar export chaperone FliS [Rhodanobacteraceae bacterium]